MSAIGNLLSKWRQKRERRNIPTIGVSSVHLAGPPTITTPWGNTSESARHQAALNMKADPSIKRAVEELLIRQLGDIEKGMAESRRRYFEAYDES